MQIVYTYLIMLMCMYQTDKARCHQVNKDTEAALEILTSCKHTQIVKLESLCLPEVKNSDMEMDFGTRIRFDIGMTDNQIIVNLTVTFNDEAIGACLMIKLTVLMETRIVDSQYFQLYPLNKLVGLVASIDCIQIPKSPNITLSAELFQTNQTCTCDFNMMPTDGNGCGVYRVFGYNFTASEEACIFIRDHSQEQPRLTLTIHKLSGNLSRFQVIMQNINPYAAIHVWVFPDDDDDWLTDHQPVLSEQPTASKDGIIFLSVIKEEVDNTKYFYAMAKVSCMVNDPDYGHYISGSTTITTQGVQTNGTSKNSVITETKTEGKTSSKGTDTIVIVGVVGAVICLCCIVALVWLAKFRHCGCTNMYRYDEPCRESAVLQNNRDIFTAETNNEVGDDIDTYSKVNKDYMCKYSDVNRDYMDTYSDVNRDYMDTYSMVNRDYMDKYSNVNRDYMDTYSDVNRDYMDTYSDVNRDYMDKYSMVNRDYMDKYSNVNRDYMHTYSMINRDYMDTYSDVNRDYMDTYSMINRDYMDTYNDVNKDYMDTYSNVNRDYMDTHSDVNRDYMDTHSDVNREYMDTYSDVNRDYMDTYSNVNRDYMDTYSVVNRDYMDTYSDVNRDYMDTYSNVNEEPTTNKNTYVMVLSHPDAHEQAVKTLTACLENNNVNVLGMHDKIWTNWRDFAEQAGEACQNFVIVLSDELTELVKLYRLRGEKRTQDVCRWNELLLKRHGEYIPCVVLEKLRTVHQEKGACFSVHVVNVIENSSSLKKGFTKLHKFEQTHNFLRDKDITSCYNVTREVLQVPSQCFNLLPLIKCLTEKLK